MNVTTLNRRFGSKRVKFSRGPEGFIWADIQNEFGCARLTLHGAHVTSFIPNGSDEVLWISRKSLFAKEKPIRGGVPVCWPWFGKHPSDPGLPSHGYARICEWDVAFVSSSPEGDSIGLRLRPESVPAKYQPVPVELTLEVAVESDGVLRLALGMLNCGEAPVTVSCALHTYFAVDAIENVAVDGLEKIKFTDKVKGSAGSRSGSVRIREEVDRIYQNCENDITLRDGVHTTEILRFGSRSAVVWNPWIEKSRRMADFGDEEYHRMICVETANAADDARTLEPDGFHTLGCTIIRR